MSHYGAESQHTLSSDECNSVCEEMQTAAQTRGPKNQPILSLICNSSSYLGDAEALLEEHEIERVL